MARRDELREKDKNLLVVILALFALFAVLLYKGQNESKSEMEEERTEEKQTAEDAAKVLVQYQIMKNMGIIK